MEMQNKNLIELVKAIQSTASETTNKNTKIMAQTQRRGALWQILFWLNQL